MAKMYHHVLIKRLRGTACAWVFSFCHLFNKLLNVHNLLHHLFKTLVSSEVCCKLNQNWNAPSQQACRHEPPFLQPGPGCGTSISLNFESSWILCRIINVQSRFHTKNIRKKKSQGIKTSEEKLKIYLHATKFIPMSIMFITISSFWHSVSTR